MRALNIIAPIRDCIGLRLCRASVVLLLLTALPARAQTTFTVGELTYDTDNADNPTQAVVGGYNGIGGALVIPGTITVSVGGNPTTLPVTGIATEVFTHGFGYLLTSVSIPNNVTSIGGAAFDNCTKLTSITIPSNCSTIEISAFQGCSGLTSVTLENGVADIGNAAFEGCTSLTTVTIPNTVTSIEANAFLGCTSLTSVTIPSSVTSIGNYAFDGCTSLTSAIFMGNAPTMGRGVFALDGDHTTGFIVSYYGSGFSSPMWTDSSGFSWAAANLGDASTTFSGTLVGNNLVYSPWLGYYSYTSYPLVYSYHLGYEYAFPSSSGVYLYDYKSGHFFYTQGNYYPFVYDFTRTTYLYFYQGDPDSRYFYDYADDDVIEE